MKISEITNYIESIAPLVYQESYDNSGVQVGSKDVEVTGVLLTIDVTEEVIDEAIEKKANLVIAHHPLIFSGIKRLTGKTYVERAIIKAIKNNICIYAAHTNLDNIIDGVNKKICEKLSLRNCRILAPKYGELRKLVFFVPTSHAETVRNAVFEAGAGKIGNYDMCSFNLDGNGTFRGSESANPFVGVSGSLHTENEIRVETIFPKADKSKILNALLNAHPYEEVAYDIYPLENKYTMVGAGMIGELENAQNSMAFLQMVKQIFNSGCVRYTDLCKEKIKKVAVCGGSGSFMLNDAISAGADVFITGDFKYHQFFDAESKIIIADIGHFESEQFTKEIFYDLLIKKFNTFAVHFSEKKTNKINYL